MKLELDHFKWGGVAVTHEVPDESTVVTRGLGSRSVGYSRGLNHIIITAHVRNQPCKTISH
jgi:hypothetical protein